MEIIETIIGNAINSVAVGVDTLGIRFKDNTLVRRFKALAE